MSIIKFILPVLLVSNVFSASGNTLYNKNCKSCHGKKAEKRAMGKSKIIKDLSTSTIEKDMQAYASGKRKTTSYIRKMKKDFIKKHSAKELHDLASYIHSL